MATDRNSPIDKNLHRGMISCRPSDDKIKLKEEVMMKKETLLFAVLAFVSLFFLAATGECGGPGPLPKNKVAIKKNVMTIHDENENKVVVLDFISGNKGCTENGCDLTEGDKYSIYFCRSDDSFSVDFGNLHGNAAMRKARRQVEEKFLQILGITKKEACKLKVHVGICRATAGDHPRTGEDFGLSFCPGSKKF